MSEAKEIQPYPPGTSKVDSRDERGPAVRDIDPLLRTTSTQSWRPALAHGITRSG
jgi:hypothetical protein